jgi:hypothetical protein
VFSITAGGKAVIVAGSSVGIDDGFVYFVNDANADGTIAASEVGLVGIISGFDISLLVVSNFVG